MAESIQLNDGKYLSPESIAGLIQYYDYTTFKDANLINTSCILSTRPAMLNIPGDGTGFIVTMVDRSNTSVIVQLFFSWEAGTIYKRAYQGASFGGWTKWKSITFS